MSAAAVQGNGVDLAADSGAAATVQGRAVVVGAVMAILVQPVVVCTWVLGLFGLQFFESGDWGSLVSDWRGWLGGLMVLGTASLTAIAVATPFVALLGVPAFLGLNLARRVTCVNLALAGALAGAIPLALLPGDEWPMITIAAFHGAFGGLAFYRFWRRAGGVPRQRFRDA